MSEGVAVRYLDEGVVEVEIERPPNNFFDVRLVGEIADAYHALDEDERCRCILLCSVGRHFCAGADFSEGDKDSTRIDPARPGRHLYDEAARLLLGRKPVVAAIQGAAVGGGLGLALTADLRVGGPSTRLMANFSYLASYPGFGLTATLPLVVGHQAALDILLTSRKVMGEEARQLGLLDRLAPDEQVRERARELAREVAHAAPLSVVAIRRTLRGDLIERYRAATELEKSEQARLRGTRDRAEGIRASMERRLPVFTGK